MHKILNTLPEVAATDVINLAKQTNLGGMQSMAQILLTMGKGGKFPITQKVNLLF